MTLTMKKDTDSWNKNPLAVRLGEDFATYGEMLVYQELLFKNRKDENNTTAILEMAYNDPEATPKDYLGRSTSDSSLGGNEAFNCYWQFNRDDDIVHMSGSITPVMNKDTLKEHIGVSRIYNEMYNKTQQIMWMQFGVPEYVGVADFYTELFNTELVSIQNANNTGLFGLAGKFIGTLAQIGTIAIALPFLAIKWLSSIPSAIQALYKGKSTRYYDFKESMPLYYRMANALALQIAIGMNLYDGGFNSGDVARFGLGGLPRVYPEGKLDVFHYVQKRHTRLNPNARNFKTIDDLWNMTSSENDPGLLGTMFKQGLGAYSFVGFRIEKSTDSTESFSNTTGQSSIASQLNSKVSEMRDTMFSLQDGKAGSGVLGTMGTFLGDMASNAAQSISSMLGVGTAVQIMLGNGYVDIPEVWKESSFSKSYSFDIALRSPYGDPLSVYQSIYFPLALLLTAALPRAVGANSYTQPFLVRAYSKGQFSIPLGIIDSMTIKRGSSEFGWNYQNLPTAVDVSFSIKDLSPAMFAALPGSAWQQITGENTTMNEYIATLSGFGLQERLSKFKNIMRRFQLFQKLMATDYLNPSRIAMDVGSHWIPTLIADISPYNDISQF